MNKPKVFVYWNYFDNDSKKMYEFLNEESSEFIAKARERLNIVLHKKYKDFDTDDELYSDLSDSNILLFFTHGTEDAILKKRYTEDMLKKRYTLIDIENADLFAMKKVISICCDSAKTLGPESVAHGCLAFVGFQKAIPYETGTNTLRAIIYKAYSNAFDLALTYAVQKSQSPQQFVNYLRSFVDKFVVGEILSCKERDNKSFGDLSAYSNCIKSIVALGESTEPLFI